MLPLFQSPSKYSRPLHGYRCCEILLKLSVIGQSVSYVKLLYFAFDFSENPGTMKNLNPKSVRYQSAHSLLLSLPLLLWLLFAVYVATKIAATVRVAATVKVNGPI